MHGGEEVTGFYLHPLGKGKEAKCGDKRDTSDECGRSVNFNGLMLDGSNLPIFN